MLPKAGGEPSGPLRLHDFDDLFELHGPPVHAYLSRRAPHVADDLLSDVWVAALHARATYDPTKGSVRGWLFGVAKNVLAKHHRDTARNRRAGVLRLWSPQPDPWSEVDARLDATAVSSQLRTFLADLPSDEREVLLLVAWEQLTPSEAAQTLGIPSGTARSRLHRARERMRSSMVELPSDQPSPARRPGPSRRSTLEEPND